MILGVGVDMVHVPRIERLLATWDATFLARVFSEEERTHCQRFTDPARHYAARFAAKEAFYKALSRGKSLPLWFHDAWVDNQTGGPVLILSPRAHQAAQDAGATSFHLSLSHDGEYAVAMVVAER